MIRRNFLKTILIANIGALAIENRLFAKELFSKSILKEEFIAMQHGESKLL